jgi:hypothetical protein
MVTINTKEIGGLEIQYTKEIGGLETLDIEAGNEWAT